MYLPRTLRRKLLDAMAHFPAVLVTGPRQSGKTTMLREELGASAAYVSLDDPIERQVAREDPAGFLARFHAAPVILDEIQNAPELLVWIKVLIDRERRRAGRFILTGSQSFPLMQGVSESLAGRMAIFDLLPFSLEEYGAGRSLEEVAWSGLYPEPALTPSIRGDWVRSYLRTYVERDVRQMRAIGDLRAFEEFLALLAARHGQTLNMAKLSRDVGMSQPTIKSWLGVLEASYLITLLRPYHENFGKRVTRAPKLYFLDPALVCELTRISSGAAALAGPLGGAIFEGIVVAEVHKAFAHGGHRPALWFWRSRDGLEVDLLIQLGDRLHPVEVKCTATPTPRHLAPLRRFADLAGPRAAPGALVCRVPEERPLSHGQRALPLDTFVRWLAEAIDAEP